MIWIFAVVMSVIGMFLGITYTKDIPLKLPRSARIAIQILAAIVLFSICLFATPANTLSSSQRYGIFGVSALFCGIIFGFVW